MKKIKLLFIVFILTLTSCNKDENSTPQTPNTSASIIGTWDSQPFNYVSTFDGTLVGGTPVNDGPISVISPSQDYKITFSESPNLISSTGVFSLNVNAMGFELPAINNFEFPLNGSWTRTGDVIDITNEGSSTPIKATIIELTVTSLKLSFKPEDLNIQQYIGTSYITNLVLKDNIIISFLRVTN